MNKILAIILDGFHKGHALKMEYSPVIKLIKPKTVIVDYCCDNGMSPDDDLRVLQYIECFRAVDKNIVLYSENGMSMDFLRLFPKQEFESKPWTEDITLYFGFHKEPVLRSDRDAIKIEEAGK